MNATDWLGFAPAAAWVAVMWTATFILKRRGPHDPPPPPTLRDGDGGEE